MESFHLGVRTTCKGPIRVGQTIQRVAIGTGWKYYTKGERLLYADELLNGEEI